MPCIPRHWGRRTAPIMANIAALSTIASARALGTRSLFRIRGGFDLTWFIGVLGLDFYFEVWVSNSGSIWGVFAAAFCCLFDSRVKVRAR